MSNQRSNGGALFALLATLTLGAGAAQALTVEDLQGATISIDVLYDTRIRLEGREMDAQTRWTMRMTIGSGGTTSGNFQRVGIYQGRNMGTIARSFAGKIGTPVERGEGHNLWLLSGDKLIMLRTFAVGGLKAEITFGAGGKSCSVRAPLAREMGAGNTKMDSAARPGAKVEVLSATQASSSCSVSR